MIFIATSKSDPKDAVEFEADTQDAANAIAEEHGYLPPTRVQMRFTMPADSSVEEVIEMGKVLIDKEHSTKH